MFILVVQNVNYTFITLLLKFRDSVKYYETSLVNYCFQGYSSLAVALVLPESGRLVACERDGKALEVAKRYYDQAGVSHKVITVSFPELYPESVFSNFLSSQYSVKCLCFLLFCKILTNF